MIYILLVLFIILTTLDGFLTFYGISNGYSEANPILKKLFSKVGVITGLLLMKIPVVLGSIYCVVIEQASIWFVIALVVPYTVLLIWNLHQLKITRLF